MHIDWAARHARRVLRPRRVRSGLAAINQAATVEYQPLGVVGVIGPWNYPVFTPIGSIALRAGGRERGRVQAVRAHPGDRGMAGPGVQRGAGVFGEIQPVLQLVTGPGSTGEALARSGVAKLAFTGSAATARKVMAAAADTLTPVLAECGGKDALLVSADADLEAAADAAAWGAMSNAGQTCIGIERVYVADGVYHSFLERLSEKVSSLRPGFDSEASYGPMTLPSQPETVARARGGRAGSGGRAAVGGPDAVAPPYVRPVVLTDVPEGSAAVTEETFGPTVTVTPVAGLGGGACRSPTRGVRARVGGVRPGPFGRYDGGSLVAVRDDLDQLRALVRDRAGAAVRRCRASPGSAGSTARTGCASSPGPSPSRGSGCGRWSR